MKYSVAGNKSTLRIEIESDGEKQHKLMEALQECAEGRCTCPTNQYEKLQAIDIAPGAKALNVTLTAKPGEAIDRAAIDKCLEYTATQAQRNGTE